MTGATSGSIASAVNGKFLALASNEIAANWMRDNVLEYVKGMPEVMASNVFVAEGRRTPE